MPDVRIVNTRNIVSPAFCVATSPHCFQYVDDLKGPGNTFYCIPPSRVLSRSDNYNSIRSENSIHVNCFRSVEDMNAINDALEVEVDAFTESLKESKRRKADAVLEDRRRNAAAGRGPGPMGRAGRRGRGRDGPRARQRTPVFYDSDYSEISDKEQVDSDADHALNIL